jgi:DinB family protein
MITKPDALQFVRDATARFVEQCSLATNTQWNSRSKPGAWSMGDVAEHVALANRGILSRLSKSLVASPIEERVPDSIDDEIRYLFYRGDEPPNVSTPTGAWTSWGEAKTTFEEGATALLKWVDEAKLDLRAYGVRHPVFGLMDGMQWVLFAAAHTERHRAQLIGLQRDTR